jgi:hypothetical protein
MVRTKKYYLKNNYLTLRSKIKVPWKSLRYATQGPWHLTSRSNNCFLDSIIQFIMCNLLLYWYGCIKGRHKF